MRGLSRTNLKYMRQMAAAWNEETIDQQPVGQLPWGHVTVLLDKLDDQARCDWYAAAAAQHGWSALSSATDISARVGWGPTALATAGSFVVAYAAIA